MDEVDYISGETRVFAIVGHPIKQVRSPEMITAELRNRGHNAILAPFDILPVDFERTVAQLMRMPNLDGLIFTIPYKQKAVALVDVLGVQAKQVGAINAAARSAAGRWVGDIFDGNGCVEAFHRRGFDFKDRRVMLIGAGGAGRAIAVAIAHQKPRAIHIFDIDRQRGQSLIETIGAIDPQVGVDFAEPRVDNVDFVLNASPVGMLEDPRSPIDVSQISSDVVVFDAIVKPEHTSLLTLAEQSGCRTIRGREMMRGQISKIVDFFESQSGAVESS
jgi:shikimate dehydrogenase